MDDVLLRSEGSSATKAGVSAEEIVNAFRAINAHQLPVVAAKQAAA
jgi:hypothetical protein